MPAGKYEFDPELKKFDKLKPPIIPLLAPIWQKLLGLPYHLEKSDDTVSVSRQSIPARDGSRLQALLYTPRQVKKDGPCLLIIHGGGWVYRGAPHHFVMARRFAKALNCKTLSIDYRLAPLHKFPTATEDCYSAYTWLLEHARELEIDPARIAVGGDSAGGNLSAVLCLMARDRKIQMPKAQVLVYPVTDYRMETESYKLYTDTPMCNSRDMEKYFRMYVKDGKTEPRAYLSPMEAESLEGLPAAYIEVAQYDCLHDEGIAYARALERAGVKAELQETEKTMHGYDIAVNSRFMDELMKKRVDFLKKELEG